MKSLVAYFSAESGRTAAIVLFIKKYDETKKSLKAPGTNPRSITNSLLPAVWPEAGSILGFTHRFGKHFGKLFLKCRNATCPRTPERTWTYDK